MQRCSYSMDVVRGFVVAHVVSCSEGGRDYVVVTIAAAEAFPASLWKTSLYIGAFQARISEILCGPHLPGFCKTWSLCRERRLQTLEVAA